MLLSIQEQDWPAVVSLIERAIDIEGSARASGAFGRKRQIRSASDLLRLALAYGPGGQSLRQTAAWAELQQVASLSDVALMYRLRASADWLAHIASALLGPRKATASAPTLGLRLRVIDGSVISPPGRGPRWRLHAVYDLAEDRLSGFELTGTRAAEALERADIGPGELIMGDRVYARPGGLHRVVEAGGEYLVRAGQRSLRLADRAGRLLDLAKLLDRSDHEGSCDLDVLVLDGSGKRAPLPARLVIIKKPPDAAEKARKRALRESQRGGHKNDSLSLRCAEHLMLITSLDRERADAGQLGELYRLRWRIELAFKRLKSLLSLDRLPARDKNLARSWILAHLIVALLIEDFNPELRDSPP
jgi:hypothetical protein